MDEQVRSARVSYESTLSSKQKELLKAVETGDLYLVKRYFNRSSESLKQDKWLDYVLLTTAVEKRHQAITMILLKSGCRVRIEEKTKFLCTPLYYTVKHCDTRIACELVKKGASIRDTDVNEISPLECAVQNDEIKIVEVILRFRKHILSHEKLNPHDKNDQALFQIACYKNNMQAVKEFLELQFPINTRSSFSKKEWKGFTLLHFSVSEPRGTTVDLLLEHGADVLVQDESGETPIHLAFRNNAYEPYALKYSKLFNRWLCNLADKDFSNPEDKNGLSHFHIICCACDDENSSNVLNAVQFFLNNKVNVNHSVSLKGPAYPGYTALHFAAKHVQLSIMKLILAHGADVTKADKGGLTPLHVICDRSRLSPEQSSGSGASDLESDRLEIARLLLSAGSDVDAKDLRGSTPLHYAFSLVPRESTEIEGSLTRLLVSRSQLKSNITDCDGLSYLHIASSADLAAVKTLVKYGAPLDSCVNTGGKFKPGYCALHFAILYGKVEIVEYLLKNGVDPNTRVNYGKKLTPLHLACTYVYTYDQTHSHDQTPNDGLSSDLQSHQTAKIRIIELLLKHGASINVKDAWGNTPLSTACELPPYFTYMSSRQRIIPELIYAEQRSMIEILLRHGGDVRSRNNNHESVLHVIVDQPSGPSCDQRKTLAELMLSKGANINASDARGLTPLHVVVKNSMRELKDSSLSLIQLLLEYGADVNAKSGVFDTPFHIAAKFPCHPVSSKTFLCLLEHPETDLNAQNVKGETPLHLAVNVFASSTLHSSFLIGEGTQIKNRFCIEKLLQAGADVNKLDSNGLTPMHKLCEWLMKNYSRSAQRYRDFFAFIVTHLKRLAQMDLLVNEKVKEELNALSLLSIEWSLAIDIAIDEEWSKLKSKTVDRYTCLHEILFKDATGMAKHVKNKDFRKMMTSPNLRFEFPQFHDILIRKFKMGSARSLVLGPAKEALQNVLQVRWPDSCSEHILKYLSNRDLERLAKSIPVESAQKRPRNSAPLDESQPKVSRLQ